MPTPPYHVYLEMDDELSQEACTGLAEFSILRDMQCVLLTFRPRPSRLLLASWIVVAALFRGLLVAHAQPEGMTERIIATAQGWGRPVWALDVACNAYLWTRGVERFTLEGRP